MSLLKQMILIFATRSVKYCLTLWILQLISVAIFAQGSGFSSRLNGSDGFSVTAFSEAVSLQFADKENDTLTQLLEEPGRGLGGLLLFSPNGKLLVSSGDFSTITNIYRLDADGAHLEAKLPYRSRFAAFSPDGQYVYLLHSYSFWTAILSQFNVTTFEEIKRRKVTAEANSLTVNSDGSRIAYSSLKLIQQINSKSFKKDHVGWQKDRQYMFTYNPIRKSEAVSVSDKQAVQLRDVETDELLFQPVQHRSSVAHLLYSPDGNLLASLDRGGELYVYDLKLNKVVGYTTNVQNAPSFNDDNELFIYKNARWEKLALNLPLEMEYQSMRTPDAQITNRRFRALPQPIISYTPETGLLLGASANLIWDTKSDDSSVFRQQPIVLQPSIAYGLGGKQLISGVFIEAYPQGKWHFVNRLSYINNGNNYYFGLGNDAEENNRIGYRSDFFKMQGSASYILFDKVFAGISYKLRHDTPIELDRENESIIESGTMGGWLFGVGPTIRIDQRNSILYPTKGRLFELSLQRYSKAFVSSYQYNEFSVDYRNYFSVNQLAKGSTLAIQLVYNAIWGGTAPFYEMPYLSSDRLLRGVWRNLFIDEQIAFAQAEFRSFFSPADTRYGYSLFAGLGDATPNFFNGYDAAPKFVYGAGFRQQLIPELRLDSRLDFALTNEGNFGVFFGIGVAF